ncbi:leukotriene B4 receptor 1-like [Xyrichtys novacula]|uniref:Leukotriene B4 receptor 1-like n=1 Tax=Xyrichtys novacula TaxID=13765 RepID=A0AAV1GTI7_XYRNO|nr:leukotriene B4 receptor 1-like [Xyrichtys novacula]
MEQLNSTVVTTISSSSPGHPPPSSQDFRALVTVVVLSLCSILGIPGNIAVIILRPNWQQMSSLSQSLMLNLAVADLLNLITLPLWIHAFLHGWSFGLLACKLISYLIYCCIHCCLLTVIALSLQRYLQVVHGKKWFQQRGQKRLLALLWLVAIILSIPVLVDRQIISVRNLPQCESVYSSLTEQVALLLEETVMGIVSVSVVVFAYIRLKRKVDRAALFNNPQTTCLITSIIVTFFIFWVPFLIVNMLGLAAIFSKNEKLMKFCTDKKSIFRALVFLNSSLDPFLYAFASRNFCTACLKQEHKNNCSTSQEI